MWHYVLLLLRRQQGKSVLASSGFFLAACALVLLSATSQTTVAQGNQIISQSWRSSYDLVVLPPQAQHASHNTIPADLLEGYNGGISTQQYEQIKHLSGVEVAAPIAFLGYVQMPVPQLNFFYTPLPTGFYRVDLGLVVFTGQRQLVERGQTTLYYHFASCDGMPALNTPAAQVLDALGKQDIIIQCGTEQIFETTPSVDTGTFLMAAIDPAAENQLVHLEKSITAGRMLTTKDNVHFDTNPQMGRIKYCPTQNTPPSQCISTVPNYDIPVLFQTQLPGRITLKGSFTRLSPASLDPKTAFARGGFAYLAHLPSLETIFGGEIPLVQNDPQRFSVSTLVLENHSWLPYNPYNGIDPYLASLRFLYAPSSLTYASTRGPDGQASSAYTLVPDGTQGPEAAFRRLQPVHIAEVPKPTRNAVPLPKAFYFFDFTGKIAGNTLNAQFSNPLNWLPENTYASPPTVLRYDAQGNSVAPTNLLPTNNTAGFILQPPLVLTTLNAAVNLHGNDIISAIRIRVSGIDVANPASWKRIQQVAGLIEQRTQLRVLVTLGSSPRPTLVYVPGIKQGQFGSHQNIDPVGWVEERWISIGVSILYLAQLGATRLLLIGAVLAVCLGYLVVAFSSLVASQRREFAILNVLGWRPWQPI